VTKVTKDDETKQQKEAETLEKTGMVTKVVTKGFLHSYIYLSLLSSYRKKKKTFRHPLRHPQGGRR
tara:strand:- start:363 stop:560 length:198 start_codon:yes stop_codon:yes gene_type:complete